MTDDEERVGLSVRSLRLGLRPEVWLARADLVDAIEVVADRFREAGLEREADGALAVREVVEILHP